MKYVNWRRHIKGPARDEFTADVTMILATIAGYSGGGSRIKSLAKELKLEIDVPGSRKVAPIFGVGRFSKRYEEALAGRIAEGIRLVRERGGQAPKVVLVGKSMGGRVLHKVSQLLHKRNIPVDLFIGVDTSRGLSFHYHDYVESNGNTKYAMVFDANIRRLVNLYENRRKDGQNGHVFLWRNTRNQFPATPFFDPTLNINVARDPFNKETLSVDDAGEIITMKNPTHTTIGEDTNVVDIVKRYVWRTVIA